jgi:hypothetical protein
VEEIITEIKRNVCRHLKEYFFGRRHLNALEKILMMHDKEKEVSNCWELF